ncbi:MAG: hypothetical protein AAFP02_04940, partial [Bacteroidota bacterium]
FQYTIFPLRVLGKVFGCVFCCLFGWAASPNAFMGKDFSAAVEMTIGGIEGKAIKKPICHFEPAEKSLKTYPCFAERLYQP